MKENKDRPSKVSTCFEESPCAEMMQKIMSEQGIGSVCEEMMRSLVSASCGYQEKPRETGKTEVKEEENGQERESAQGKRNNQKTGGMK